MPGGPRGTEDFGSWAARRQRVLALHLDTADTGSPRVVWDTFRPTSKWKTVVQTRSHFPAGPNIFLSLSFFFFLS